MALFDNIFIQMAFWACLLSSLASGVIGSLIVVKRISFIAGSIAHSVLGGMGLCLWLQRTFAWHWLDPIWGAFASAIGSALLLGWVHLRFKQREDALIAVIWSTGMAVGMIFLSITPGTTPELLNYLFGNVLWIETKDLVRLGIMNVLILGSVGLYYHKFLALCFDEEQAELQGVKVKKMYLALLCLVAISIVLLMQVIGTVLVIAMLAIPATLANIFTHRLVNMMVLATVFSAFFSIVGLGCSYVFDWPPAATIALLAAVSYLIILPGKKLINVRNAQGPSI